MSMTRGKWSQPAYTLSREGSRNEYPVHAAKRGRIVIAYRQDDARAIAALPDLVEALKETLNQLDTLQLGHSDYWTNELRNMVSATRFTARAALTKAGVTQ